MSISVIESQTLESWYLYIVENKFLQLYTGITKDVGRRIKEHNSNSVKSAKALRGKGPIKLLFCCQLYDHSSALKTEIWVKKQSALSKRRIISSELTLNTKHKIICPTLFD